MFEGEACRRKKCIKLLLALIISQQTHSAVGCTADGVDKKRY